MRSRITIAREAHDLRRSRQRWVLLGIPLLLLADPVAANVLAESRPPGLAARPSAVPELSRGRGNLPTAEKLDSRVPVAWFNLLYDLIKAERISPPVASRQYGIAAVTLYEAAVPGMPGYQSLAGQLNELAPPPPPEPHKKYHWAAVANAALARISRGLFAGASASTLSAIDSLERRFAAEFQAAVPPPIYVRSVAQGQAVADAMDAWAASDGFTELNNCAFTPPVGPGLWEPTPPAFLQSPLQPCWGRLRPFVLASGAECAPPPPPAHSEEPASEFYALALEVYDTVNNLTPEQNTIALFWADGPGATGTPPGHWISIMAQIAEEEGLSLATAAEGFARVGISVTDAFIECWNCKYQYNVLRPVTYVQEVLDASWLPLLATPNFPEYTSGHSTQSGASATVLTDMFGDRTFTDRTHEIHNPSLGLGSRTFRSFNEASAEAAVSRLYGGIHFRIGNEMGLASGMCVGRTIVDRVLFRAQEDPE